MTETGIARKGRFRRLRKLAKLLRSKRYRSALRHGVAAAVEHEDVAFEHSFASIIDVGTHHGQFALLAWSRFPEADLFCVEPLPEAQKRLRTVLARHSCLTILPVAASSVSGTADYHISHLTDSSSLLPITEKYTNAFPGTEEATTTTVDTARLDDLFADRTLARPCLLKVDVQGSELDVLEGGVELLGQVDAIFVECSFVEFYEGQPLIDIVIDYLHAGGFRLRGIYSVVRDGQGHCLQADLLFGRSDGR